MTLYSFCSAVAFGETVSSASLYFNYQLRMFISLIFSPPPPRYTPYPATPRQPPSPSPPTPTLSPSSCFSLFKLQCSFRPATLRSPATLFTGSSNWNPLLICFLTNGSGGQSGGWVLFSSKHTLRWCPHFPSEEGTPLDILLTVTLNMPGS